MFSADERNVIYEVVYSVERAVEEAAYHFEHGHRCGYCEQHTYDNNDNQRKTRADRETYQSELTHAIGDLGLVALPYKIEHEADERQKPQRGAEEAEEEAESLPAAYVFV